jgi:TPR repeat protein
MVRGEYLPKDVAKASQLYKTACDGQVGTACFDLAMMNLAGPAASQDPVRAQALFKQACDAGEARGCARVKKTR